jgi:hypothetical protein
MRFLIFFALSHSCCKKVLQIVIECQRKYYLNQKVRHFLKSGKSEGEFFFPDLEIYRSLWLDGKSSKSFSRRKDRPLISCGVLICCCHFSEAHELFIIKRVLRLSDIKIMANETNPGLEMLARCHSSYWEKQRRRGRGTTVC